MNLEVGVFRADTVRVSARRTRWRRNDRQIRALAIFSLLLIDIAAICVGFGATAALLSRHDVLAHGSVGLALTGLLVLHLGIAVNTGAYQADRLRSPWAAMVSGIHAFLLAAGAVVLMAFCFKFSSDLSRLALSCGVVVSTALIALGRDQFVRHATALMGANVYSTALIMDGDHQVPLDNISIVIAAGDKLDPDRHDPAMYDRLAKTLAFADRVIVACPPERRMSWAHALKGANIQSEIIVPELLALQPLGHGWHHGMPTVTVARGPLRLTDRALKRAFDLVMSSIALILLAPLLLLTAIAVKLDSRGPVFFVQTRIGRGNKQFRMMKFRSMRSEECDGPGHASTARDDGRITRVGRLIRSTSVDELPQLFNVLRGDMSVVGPRPHALGSRAENKLFWEIDGRYWHRHAIKPGLTGLAQVRGFRGATHRRLDLVNRLQADLEYVDNWSILRDIAILFMTARVVLHRNAF